MGKMIEYHTEEVLAVIDKAGTHEKLVTLTQWGAGPVKIDIRAWRHIGSEYGPGKGIALTWQEARAAAEAILAYLDALEDTDDD